MLNQFGVDGINFAVRNLNFLHGMKKQETDVMTVCGASNIQIYRPALKGKYKNVHRIKVEVRIPDHVFAQGGSLFDVPLGLVLAIPQDELIQEMHNDSKQEGYYTVEINNGDVFKSESRKDFERHLDAAYDDHAEFPKGEFVIDGRKGEAFLSLKHSVDQMPLDVVHTLLSWGKISIPSEMNGMSLELYKLLNDRYEAAEKVTMEESQEAAEGANTNEI